MLHHRLDTPAWRLAPLVPQVRCCSHHASWSQQLLHWITTVKTDRTVGSSAAPTHGSVFGCLISFGTARAAVLLCFCAGARTVLMCSRSPDLLNRDNLLHFLYKGIFLSFSRTLMRDFSDSPLTRWEVGRWECDFLYTSEFLFELRRGGSVSFTSYPRGSPRCPHAAMRMRQRQPLPSRKAGGTSPPAGSPQSPR